MLDEVVGNKSKMLSIWAALEHPQLVHSLVRLHEILEAQYVPERHTAAAACSTVKPQYNYRGNATKWRQRGCVGVT